MVVNRTAGRTAGGFGTGITGGFVVAKARIVSNVNCAGVIEDSAAEFSGIAKRNRIIRVGIIYTAECTADCQCAGVPNCTTAAFSDIVTGV